MTRMKYVNFSGGSGRGANGPRSSAATGRTHRRASYGVGMSMMYRALTAMGPSSHERVTHW
jgi:hypothetical protein